MTSSSHRTHSTPDAAPARARRDSGLRTSRRVSRSLVAFSAALVLGFSGLAATTASSFGARTHPAVTQPAGGAKGSPSSSAAPPVTSSAS